MTTLWLVLFMLALVRGLKEEEIERLRKELDTELLKLEAVKDLKDAIAKHDASRERSLGAVPTLQAKTGTEDTVNELLRAEAAKARNNINSKSLDELLADIMQKPAEKNLNNDRQKQNDSILDDLLQYLTKEKDPARRDELVVNDFSLDEIRAMDDLLGNYADDEKQNTEKYEVEKKQAKEESDGQKRREESCRDKRPDCAALKSYCNVHSGMKESCPQTCAFCVPCKDEFPKQQCLTFRDKHQLCDSDAFKDRLKKVCYDTCGYCRTSSPPACMTSPYGCCWDNVSPRSRDGVCQLPCQDSEATKRLCKKFAVDYQTCHAKGLPGEWMRKHCPVSCKLCDPTVEERKSKCVNHPSFSDQCQEWKTNGDCVTDEVVKNVLCKFTCGTCSPDAIEASSKNEIPSAKV